jgi:hypothetical protein
MAPKKIHQTAINRTVDSLGLIRGDQNNSRTPMISIAAKAGLRITCTGNQGHPNFPRHRLLRNNKDTRLIYKQPAP